MIRKAIGKVKGMLNKNQEQKVEGSGVALQAARDIYIKQGASYSEVKDICTELLRPALEQLTNIAREVAQLRGEKITEAFILQLNKEYPAGLNKAKDPDFQFALSTVQKEYARSGDEDLGALLVNLLVDRCKQKQRDILQIVLNESLNTAPKLTEAQLAALAVIFMLRYTRLLMLIDHNAYGAYLDKHIAPFVSKIVKNRACYQHLQYTGCGSIEIGELRLESYLGSSYQGLFLKGFDQKEVDEKGVSISDKRFFVPCLNDKSKFQVAAINKDHLQESFNTHAISPADQDKISALFNLGKMSDKEIKNKYIEIRPYMSAIFDCWSESEMKGFSLTSVGIAIGHANIKRLAGEFADLSIWIN